jgi:hypothetical protein
MERWAGRARGRVDAVSRQGAKGGEHAMRWVGGMLCWHSGGARYCLR